MTRRLAQRSRLALRIGIGSLIIIILTTVSLYRVPTTFSINVVTQLAELTTAADHRFPWYFDNATVYLGDDRTGRPFSGTLLVRPETRVTFQRIGSGPLRLRCQSLRKGSTVARLADAGGSRPMLIEDRLVLVVGQPAGQNGSEHLIVLPMSGRVVVGAEVVEDMGSEPTLLLGGEVTLLGHTLLGERRYDAGKATLELGDYLRLDQLGDARGLLIFGREPNLRVSFRVIAKGLRISRFGSLGYEVYASPLNRIKNDHTIQAIWAASLLVFAWITKWGAMAKDEPKGKGEESK